MWRSLAAVIPLFPKSKMLRFIAALWILACAFLLVHELLLRNSSPHDFGDAEEMQELLMICLSFPIGMIGFLPFNGIAIVPVLPENDLRSIVLSWMFPFVLGYIQWFVLVPLALRRVRRKFGSTGGDDPPSSAED
jgi:hypothetical protein